MLFQVQTHLEAMRIAGSKNWALSDDAAERARQSVLFGVLICIKIDMLKH